ncbi:MAG: hypothetical protein ACM3X5_08570 [Bacillota bacterium]
MARKMTALIGIAAVVLVAWFAAGTIWNIRKGSALMRWMQDGLSMLGGRTTVRWLGSSVVEMTLRDAAAPFGSVTLVIFLEPRDLPWWPLSRLAGRRDTLIVRGDLQRPPALEIEALDRASWSGRDAIGRLPRDWAIRGAAPDRPLEIHYAEEAGLDRADRLLALCSGAGLEVRRLSVRREAPNMQVHIAFPDSGQSARAFFEALRALAEASMQ